MAPTLAAAPTLSYLALAAWPAGVCKLLAEAPILAVAPTLSYLAWAAWPAGVYKPLALAATLAVAPTLSYLAWAPWPAGVYTLGSGANLSGGANLELPGLGCLACRSI